MPPARNTLQLVVARIVEDESGAGDQVLDRLRHQDLRGPGLGGDAGTDRYRDPRALPVDEVALAGVHARADLDTELADPFSDLERAPDRARGPVKCRVEAIA